MYALAVSGSPRRGGNTELLLKEVLTELKDAGWKTELVRVGGTAIRKSWWNSNPWVYCL